MGIRGTRRYVLGVARGNSDSHFVSPIGRLGLCRFVVLSLYSLTAVKTRHAWEDAEPKGLKSFITDGA